MLKATKNDFYYFHNIAENFLKVKKIKDKKMVINFRKNYIDSFITFTKKEKAANEKELEDNKYTTLIDKDWNSVFVDVLYEEDHGGVLHGKWYNDKKEIDKNFKNKDKILIKDLTKNKADILFFWTIAERFNMMLRDIEIYKRKTFTKDILQKSFNKDTEDLIGGNSFFTVTSYEIKTTKTGEIDIDGDWFVSLDCDEFSLQGSEIDKYIKIYNDTYMDYCKTELSIINSKIDNIDFYLEYMAKGELSLINELLGEKDDDNLIFLNSLTVEREENNIMLKNKKTIDEKKEETLSTLKSFMNILADRLLFPTDKDIYKKEIAIFNNDNQEALNTLDFDFTGNFDRRFWNYEEFRKRIIQNIKEDGLMVNSYCIDRIDRLKENNQEYENRIKELEKKDSSKTKTGTKNTKDNTKKNTDEIDLIKDDLEENIDSINLLKDKKDEIYHEEKNNVFYSYGLVKKQNYSKFKELIISKIKEDYNVDVSDAHITFKAHFSTEFY